MAGRFEFKGAALEGPVAALSGGWQTRVKLAALLLHEPTNFLDLRNQILPEHFLRGYRESCLIVSHDRAFLGATCERTLDLARGKLTVFPGKVIRRLSQIVTANGFDLLASAARSFHKSGVQVVMLDGNVRFVADSVLLSVWRAAASSKGNEPLGLD